MADRDELTLADMANDPNILRLTVRPEGVAAPPITDVGEGQPWGAPADTGRPSGRLFEPDQTPVRPTIGERIGVEPFEGWPSLVEGAQTLGRGIGGLVQGARGMFNAPQEAGPPRAAADPTAAPRAMWQGNYPSPQDPTLLQRGTQAVGTEIAHIPEQIRQGYEHSATSLEGPPELREPARQAATEWVTDVNLNLAGAGMAGASIRGGASAGVFGGRLSKFHDPDKERLAQLMEGNGVPPQQIWKDTGYVKFADGKWAHEIPDIGSSYIGNNFQTRLKMQQGEQLYLPDVINHPELFKAYPDLRKMPVSRDAYMQASGAYASAVPGEGGKIFYREEGAANQMARGRTLETLLHEIQHGIAQIENFAKGTNPAKENALIPGTPANAIYNDFISQLPMQGLSPKRRKDLENALASSAGFEAYTRSAGENVANLTTFRKDMTPEQLAGVFPPGQFRTPMHEQIPEFNPHQLKLEDISLPTSVKSPSGQAQMGGVLSPTPREMQMSAGPSGLMPPKSQRKAQGSFNPLDEMDVTWKGKPMAQFNPQDWKEFGDHYGVKNMGPLSKVEKYISPDGYTFEIPGGTKGTWTYYDLLHMKANPINPNNLPHELHIEMQKKLGRTMTPHGEVGQDQIWNGLMFGMTSQNNPLFPNQMSASRLRLRDPKMLETLADAVPWEPGATHTRTGEPITKEMRTQYDRAIGRQFGIGAGPEGLGTRGSINYTYVSELAQMFRKNPEWFRKKPDEDWTGFVERLATQTKGLSMKTGSFGSVWQDPFNAAISAIDRHMVKEFDRRGGLFLNQAEKDAWQTSTLAKWNKEFPEAEWAGSWQELTQKSGSDGFIGKKLLEYVGSHDEPKFRVAKTGAIHPDVQPHLAAQKWLQEPDKVVQVGAAYKRALAANQKAANEQGLNLFMSQWYEWDRIRQRFEPHENMFPGLSQMPAPSRRQLELPNIAHMETGHKTYEKGPTGQLQPTKRFPRNPSEMGYLGIPLAAGGAAGIGSVVRPDQYQPEGR